MTVRIDQIADAIINAPGSFVKVSESIGVGSDIIIDSDTWTQFMPRVSSKNFYIPVAGKYRIDLDFMCFVDITAGNGTFSFKIIVDDGELNEQEIGNLEDWRYRTDFVDGYSQQHFVSSAELSVGVHTLKVYGRRIPESSGGTIYISQDVEGETPRATSVIFQSITGSGAGGILVDEDVLSSDFSITAIYPTFEDSGIEISVNNAEDESLFLVFAGEGEKSSPGNIYIRYNIDGSYFPSASGFATSVVGISSTKVNLSHSVFTPQYSAGARIIKLQVSADSSANLLINSRLAVVRYRGGLVPIQLNGEDKVGQPRALNFQGAGLEISEDTGVANIRLVPDSRLPQLEWLSVSNIKIMPAFGETAVRLTLQDNKQRTLTGSIYFDPSSGIADGGLDDGTEQSNVWYYLYLVPKTGNDNILDVRGSINSPEIGPVGYTNFKYIGSARNDRSSNLIRFYQSENIFNYAHRIEPTACAALTKTNLYDPAITLNISDTIPKTSRISLMNFSVIKNGSSSGGVYGELFVDGYIDSITTNPNASNQSFDSIYSGDSSFNSEQKDIEIPTPTILKQIGYRIYGSISPSNHGVYVLGWVDGYLSSSIQQSSFGWDSDVEVDKINEGNTKAEVKDIGSDGYFYISTEGKERYRIDSDGYNVWKGYGSSPDETMSLDSYGNLNVSGELKIKVYYQSVQPTLTSDYSLAMWINTENSDNETYLLFRKSSGDIVKVLFI